MGIPWGKSKDTIGVYLDIPVEQQSKGGMLKHLASIFDSLEIISPVTLTGKDMYREANDLKIFVGWATNRAIKNKVDELE